MWFANGGSNSIGRITTAGVVTNYANNYGVPAGPLLSSPSGITVGPDGAM